MSSTYEHHLSQILASTNGALLAPLKTVAKILGLATRTLYNQIHKKTFPLTVVKIGKRSFVRASDLASLISGTSPQHRQQNQNELQVVRRGVAEARPRGRPRKTEGAVVQNNGGRF